MPSSTRRTPLSKERVLNAAMALADLDGLEALSMRRLAQQLGVEAMSLYNHVANKGEILDGIVDLAVSEIELPVTDEPWDVAIRKCAISAHETFLRHPWACSLVMSPGSSQIGHSARLRYIEWLLRQLREAGFSPDLTYHAYHTLDSHILGFTMWQLGHSAAAASLGAGKDFADLAADVVRELRAQSYPYLAEHAEQHVAAASDESEGEFEFGLDLILDGLKRAHAESPGA
jgi:AcrR family transcriptional regulator